MAAGKRRAGQPRSDAERRKRHEAKYGKKAKLPLRGTGLKKK